MFDGPPPPPPTPSCETIYGEPETFYEPTLDSIYPPEHIAKYETPLNHYLPGPLPPPPFIDTKPIDHKCLCGKALPPPPPPPCSSRLMPTVSRYYQREYCDEPIIETITTHTPLCSQCGCPCDPCDDCGQFGHCSMSPIVIRTSTHRILPLGLPSPCNC